MPAIRDPGQRAALYPRVLPLLDGLPKALGGGTRASKGTEGRFVRIELRGRRTLTLAEVEVYQRRPEHRPARQGHPEEHRLRRRRRASDRRQQERRLRRRRPDPYRGEHPESLVGGRPRRRVTRSTRSPSGTGRTATFTSGSIAIPSRSSTRAARSSSRPQPAGPEGGGHDRGRRDRAGGIAPTLGDGRADFGPRQGGRDLQGPREVRQG